ncbi:hypothetical protein C8A00DRAFT_33722 [Chaetomidium leptoderma]|uniref:Uncharacterized protein n=1 Tax=Chaetomidium leptoderma TaxID=669021 RepID=A0AAN6ZYH5_9PEZI|nr:hypothetical protein C8A00DRAFT_33722 [Chaetomidium leptoderma]
MPAKSPASPSPAANSSYAASRRRAAARKTKAAFYAAAAPAWYTSADGEASAALVPSKNVWGREDPQRKVREAARLGASDQLVMMKKGAKMVRELGKERKKEVEERERELRALEKEQRREDRRRERKRRREDEGGREGARRGVGDPKPAAHPAAPTPPTAPASAPKVPVFPSAATTAGARAVPVLLANSTRQLIVSTTTAATVLDSRPVKVIVENPIPEGYPGLAASRWAAPRA